MANLLEERRVPYAFPINVKHNLETPLQRGMLVSVEGINAQEFDVYDVVAVDAKKRVAMITEVAMSYEDTFDERDFVLPKGKVGRANYLQRGEIYTVAKSLLSGTKTKGTLIKPKASGHDWEDATGAEDAVAIVLKEVNYEGQESVWIEIL